MASNGNTVYHLPYLLKTESILHIKELYVITFAVIIKISLKGCAFVTARTDNAL
jgi:hypothetical protein